MSNGASAPPRIKVVGHLCLDLTPPTHTGLPLPGELQEVGPLDLRVGGCVANTGLALASLGADVELEAAVGDDPLGDLLDEVLRSSAAASRAPARITLTRVASHTTSYSVVLEPPGEDRRFLHHVGVNASFDGRDVSVEGVGVLHIGYPSLLPALLGDGGAGLRALLDRARAAGCTTSVDLATSDARDADARRWSALLDSWAPAIDVLSPSVDDLRFVGKDIPSDPLLAARALADDLVARGVAVALVTAGAAGMALATGSRDRLAAGGATLAELDGWSDQRRSVRSGRVPARRTTGAGDIASAALLAGIASGLDPAATLRLAASAAALHVSGASELPDGRLHDDFPGEAARLIDDPDWLDRLVVEDHDKREPE